VLLAVAVVAAALFLTGLGAAPFVDPPEGVHAAIADAMLRSGDWITPRLDGIRYFDKPPLLSPRVAIVNGRRANLAVGATFPEAADLFWDAGRLEQAWLGPRRIFLISSVRPERSAVRGLPADRVHHLAAKGGR
jgi:hypothetical protein